MIWPWKRNKVLLKRTTSFNAIRVVQEKDGTNLLYLDRSSNIHSIYKRGMESTEAYWDDFCIIPPLVKKGKVAILGLGGGTSVYLYRKHWPNIVLDCWEIDKTLVEVAKVYFGFPDEQDVRVNIENAFSDSFFKSPPYSSIIIDLFLSGKFIPELQDPLIWKKIKNKLSPGGRLMVNLSGKNDKCLNVCNLIKMEFQELCIKKTKEASNVLVMSGRFPNKEKWIKDLPECLKNRVQDWGIY